MEETEQQDKKADDTAPTSQTVSLTEYRDSIEIGSASKFGKIKVYGDSANPADFKSRIDNAITVLKHANLVYNKATS